MKKRWIISFLIVAFAAFMAHRLTRELHFFVISKAFEKPQAVKMPEGFASQSATECAPCHEEITREWETSIHANAWKDPYFQVDFEFDGSQQICLNCHTPLTNQQENLVVSFNGGDRFNPVLKPNPDFDPRLKNEGVTCVVCHVEDGVIIGPYDLETDAHPVRKDDRFTDGSGVCARCHLVKGDRWDVFLKVPPCGNFAEIEETGIPIDCVKCHMPKVMRPMAEGAPVRAGGRHLWRGGHDRQKVKKALKVELKDKSAGANRMYTLYVTNQGAEHRLPTGTPDRHLEVSFRLFDGADNLIDEQSDFLQRIILWRPFIIDLWDSRLKFNETKSYEFGFSMNQSPAPAYLIAEVKYGLLREKQRVKIGYENKTPIKYNVFHKKISLQ